MTRPLVVAHRGHSALFPENTLAAYEAAIAAGADIVETDARLTADGVVVSAHDADIGRIAVARDGRKRRGKSQCRLDPQILGP